jgi:hypothetical protein
VRVKRKGCGETVKGVEGVGLRVKRRRTINNVEGPTAPGGKNGTEAASHLFFICGVGPPVVIYTSNHI